MTVDLDKLAAATKDLRAARSAFETITRRLRRTRRLRAGDQLQRARPAPRAHERTSCKARSPSATPRWRPRSVRRRGQRASRPGRNGGGAGRLRDARRRRCGARRGARLFRRLRAVEPRAAADRPGARDPRQESLRRYEIAGARPCRRRAGVRRPRRRLHRAGQRPSGAPSAEFSRADAEPAPSRAAALALIDNVASHMRRVEPSSPAPYLLDRAKALASRDFLSLLQDVLPEDDLASMKNGR